MQDIAVRQTINTELIFTISKFNTFPYYIHQNIEIICMNIIVTGASRGIGFETVKALAANPESRIIALARNDQGLKLLKQQCEEINQGSVYTIAIDLSTADIKEDLLPQIQKRFSSIDVIVHAAGALVNKPLLQTTDKELEYIYKVNVFSAFKLVRDLLPLLTKAKAGAHIVMIGSMGGVQGSAKFSGLAAYSSSKGALSVLTECLAVELKEQNIAVNCLAPGAVQTEMLQEAFPGYQASVSAAQMAHYIAEFALTARSLFNGRIIPVSAGTP
jgi:NAD(P)-dependent dehydrogenase (short-subunit alcohol dehydrogenase family)